MKTNKTPSIISLTSRFQIGAIVLMVFLTISITFYWLDTLVSEKQSNWAHHVQSNFSEEVTHRLNDIEEEVDAVYDNPIIRAYLLDSQHKTNNLIHRNVVSLLTNSASKLNELKSLMLVTNNGNVLARNDLEAIDPNKLERITPRISLKNVGQSFEGVFKDVEKNDYYLKFSVGAEGSFIPSDLSVSAYVSLNQLVDRATGRYGPGNYYIEQTRHSVLGEVISATNGDTTASQSVFDVINRKGKFWLIGNLGDDHQIFIELNDPHFGITNYFSNLVWVISFCAVAIGLFLFARSMINKKFIRAMESITRFDLKSLIDPDSFKFKEGKIISSIYKTHIDDLTMQVRDLEQLAHKDPLTGFLNSRSFLIEIDRLTHQKDSEFFLLSIDVNHFDRIATAYGVSVANQMLIYMSEKINDFLTLQKVEPFQGMNEGFIMGVLSPQRFGVVFNGKDKNIDETYLAQNIINITKRTIRINNNEIFATTNIGTSFYPYDAQACNDLLQRANIALEKSKDISEATYCVYSGEFQGDLVRVETLQSDMHRAQKNNEFGLLYQPIFNERNQTIGVEALIRWNHPTFGNISPDEFISIAERNGFIVDIGYWILIHACQQCATWVKNGLKPLRMSVNISCKQLLDRDFSSKVFHAIESSGVSPQMICLEITETIAMNADETIQKNIASIKEMGVSVAMDDFGTGHSSLARLMDMQVNIVKIDRGFVKDIENIEAKLKIVRSIVEMTRAMEIDVICEGVENFTQLNLLKEMGIKKFQGFVFSQPLTDIKIEERVRSESNNVISIDMRKH